MVTTRAVRVGIETAGTLTRGQTVADVREHFRWEHLPLIEVAVGVAFPRLLTSLVTALTGPRSLT
jgi:inosine-uridine nucleoside N-ribohydrolase